jgi:hypothetical protein
MARYLIGETLVLNVNHHKVEFLSSAAANRQIFDWKRIICTPLINVTPSGWRLYMPK